MGKDVVPCRLPLEVLRVSYGFNGRGLADMARFFRVAPFRAMEAAARPGIRRRAPAFDFLPVLRFRFECFAMSGFQSARPSILGPREGVMGQLR
jgi:hypothetical protein